MKTKFKKILTRLRKWFAEYISTNRLFLTYVILSTTMTILIREFTINNAFDFKPLLFDFSLILIIGAISYLIKPKKQFNYLFILMTVFCILCLINSIYYTFFMSFTSFSLLSTLGQVSDVTDSIVERLKLMDFIYLLAPVIFVTIHKALSKTSYYTMVSKVEKSKKMCLITLIIGGAILGFSVSSLTGTDYSRLSKQWNREYIVERFGIIIYQGNDLIQSLTPKISSLFGYDKAAKKFRDFYEELWTNEQHSENEYTNILKGKNVIFIHMESLQSFLVGKSINGVELTPTVNSLIDEGLFFSNFFPQISVGTSSDTEFTLLTSLMPALSGTVFVSYYDRDYLSIPKLLKDQGYYTFSMHGNKADMWNRANAHESLGYDDFYSKPSFEVNDTNTVGLGISDQAFFLQAQNILQNIENDHGNYMGTMITLSNHSPFFATDKGNREIYNDYGKLDLTNTYTKVNPETKEEEIVTDTYLDGTKLGNYIITAHYADGALGELVNYVKNTDYFNDTVFVFYGDHDAKLSSSEYQYYYNYDITTGEVYEEGNPNYVDFDYYSQELNRNTPLIIWSKDTSIQKKLKQYNHGINNNVMGMYDVLPTIGNMMGFESPYALGHDIFDIGEDNVVIFPNGNFVTNKIYFNNSSSSYVSLNKRYYNRRTKQYETEVKTKVPLYDGEEIDEDYIEKLKQYAEKRLDISNAIIVYDLIKKEGNKIAVAGEVSK